jgi:hypothetical protein
VFVVGAEGSESYGAASWNGPEGLAPLRPYKVGSDHNFFILKLTGAGTYKWHMFFESKSFGFGLALDAQDNLVMDGTSRVVWNGIRNYKVDATLNTVQPQFSTSLSKNNGDII